MKRKRKNGIERKGKKKKEKGKKIWEIIKFQKIKKFVYIIDNMI